MKYINSFIILLMLLISALPAQDNNGFVLLKKDVDARAAAMVGTYTALATDASASFYNPAGLAMARETTFVAMYNDWILDFSHSYAAVQFVQSGHNFALSFNYFQMPGIPIRITSTENPDGITDAFNLAAGLSYATSISDWQVGGSVKYLFEKYYLASAPGWVVDLGILRKDLIDGIDFGFVVQNMGKMSELKNDATPLPLIIQAGFAYKVPNFFDDKLLLTPAIQWVSKEQAYFGLGSEFQIVEYLDIRAGLKNGSDEIIWSFGAGINYKTFHFDYAYSALEYDLASPSNMFSIGISY